MSVKVRYAGDKDIIVGKAGGSALFTPVGAGPSFPEYGTLVNTLYNYDYPVLQGGGSFTYESVSYLNTTVTIDELADGFGGTFLDWSNERDVASKPYGLIFTSFYGRTTYVNIAGTDYSNGSVSGDVAHDGSGFFTEINLNSSYSSYGLFITYVSGSHYVGSLEVPSGSGTFYNNGTYDGYDYFHDGSGGYYEQNGGSFWPFAYAQYTYTSTANQTEVPTGSGTFFVNGTFTDYISDGFGYYTTITGGSYNSYGVFIRDVLYYTTGTMVEVPSGSSNYFSPQWYGDKCYWDGMGSYYSNTSTYDFPYGSFITNDGTYNYYWDGMGGFYQV
jgi:hypothetical protein